MESEIVSVKCLDLKPEGDIKCMVTDEQRT